MRAISLRTIHGPNVYHHHSVVILRLDLDEYANTRSDTLPEFTNGLIKFLPGIDNHICSLGYAGGFIERLKTGTYLAHIIEHIALELSSLADIPVTYGKTIRVHTSPESAESSQYDVITRFQNEEAMKKCLESALELAQNLLASKSYDLDSTIHLIKKAASAKKLGISGQSLLMAAQKKNIPVRLLSNDSLMQLGYGSKRRRLQTAISDRTNLLAADIVQNKDLTKKILREAFIPVPLGGRVGKLKDLRALVKAIPPPYVIKPLDGNHGNGVCLNLQNEDEVITAYQVAKKYSAEVILEEMCIGRDYRLLVVNGKLIAAAERVPPHVTGDGMSTIEGLIEKLNMQPGRDIGHESILTKIKPDAILIECLRKQKLSLASIPEENQLVILRQNGNLSSGATAIDVTDKVHPEIVQLCERAARVIDIDICGIDLIHNDISEPIDEELKVIEVNAGPGLRMHLAPSSGKPRAVGEHIIETLFPNGEDGRIPLISVTGTNGKTTVVRMLHKIFSLAKDKCVGMTTTDGVWVGNQKIVSGDTTGPQSTHLLLSDPKVDVAILEIARGGLKRNGLGYDWSDISIITNITADHIGQDGIENLDDLVWIKSLVAERVREGGTIILNADDPRTLKIRKNPYVEKGRHVFLYSTSANNQSLREHVLCENSGCWLESGFVHVKHKNFSGPLFKITDVPAAFQGLAEFQTSNILAATAAAITAGIGSLQIIRGLQTFISCRENLGRFNIFKINDGYVILDYAHNEEAIAAMGKFLKQFSNYKKTVVLGLPGDRSTALIETSGKAASLYFDNFILRDDCDLRGRQRREVPAILEAAIQAHGEDPPCNIILDEAEAIHHALDNLEKNEIALILYEDLDLAMSVIKDYNPEPMDFAPLMDSPLDRLKLKSQAGVGWHAQQK